MKNWNDNKWNKYGVQTLTDFKETYCVNTVCAMHTLICTYIHSCMNIGWIFYDCPTQWISNCFEWILHIHTYIRTYMYPPPQDHYHISRSASFEDTLAYAVLPKYVHYKPGMVHAACSSDPHQTHLCTTTAFFLGSWAHLWMTWTPMPLAAAG